MRTETKLVAIVLLIGWGAFVIGTFAISAFVFDVGDGAVSDRFTGDEPDWGIVSEQDRTLRFENVTERAGLTYRSASSDGLEATQVMMGDAGVYVTDYDGDGTPDVLLVGGERPILFENDDGSFVETDAVPEIDGTVRSALFFDYDGDGSDDLLLLRMNDTPVLLANEGGNFEPVEGAFDDVLDVPMGAGAADYTGNGCLDVFIIQNGDWHEDRPNGLRDYNVPPGEDNGNPNYLFRGDCSTFEKATDANVEGDRWSLATSFVDLTNDGNPDIHVANDFNNDVVYLNQGDGTFERVELGEATNRNGMSSTVNDLTGNGYNDIFVTNVWFPAFVQDRMDATTFEIRARGNNLLLNEGDGSFEEVALEYDVERGGWGWAAVLEDLTNDGELDVVHTTRHMTFEFSDRRFSPDEIETLHSTYPFYRYPAVWEGTENGFEPLDAAETGFDVTDGRGIAELDVNGNGKLDLLIANNDGAFVLYENRAESGNSVILELERNESVPANGARVDVMTDEKTYHRTVHSNSDYLSQGDRRVHVGVGDAESVTIEVTWPDQTTHRFEDVPTDGSYVIDPSGSIDER